MTRLAIAVSAQSSDKSDNTPLIKEHMERSRKRAGKSYQELHEWMDSGDAENRHDILNMPANLIYAKKKWGDEGASEFLHHLKDDTENYRKSLLYKVHKALWKIRKRFLS